MQTNDYVKLVKEYLRNYNFYKVAVKNMNEDISDREIALSGVSISISSYGANPHGGTSEMTPTERMAAENMQLAEELRILKQDLSRVTTLLTRIDRSIAELPDNEAELVKLFYLDGYSYQAIYDVKHFSERWCRNHLRSAEVKLAVMLFGPKAQDKICFVRTV